MVDRETIWVRHIQILLKSYERAFSYFDKLQTFKKILKFILSDKWWMNNKKYFSLYEMILDKMMVLIDDPLNSPAEFSIMLKKEYIFIFSDDGLYELSKSLRHIFVRIINKKDILEFLPECLTEIVIDYMI